jgi:hypothetical protein
MPPNIDKGATGIVVVSLKSTQFWAAMKLRMHDLLLGWNKICGLSRGFSIYLAIFFTNIFCVYRTHSTPVPPFCILGSVIC